MAGALLRGGVRRFPWLCNVLLYGGLFAAGDAAQQLWRRRGQPPDWAQTRRVALVALAFHGNFSYVWLRALERALPGRRPPAVLGKVLCDQLLGAPVAVLAFYTGEWCRHPDTAISVRRLRAENQGPHGGRRAPTESGAVHPGRPGCPPTRPEVIAAAWLPQLQSRRCGAARCLGSGLPTLLCSPAGAREMPQAEQDSELGGGRDPQAPIALPEVVYGATRHAEL